MVLNDSRNAIFIKKLLYNYINSSEFSERANGFARGMATVESFSVADGLSDDAVLEPLDPPHAALPIHFSF